MDKNWSTIHWLSRRQISCPINVPIEECDNDTGRYYYDTYKYVEFEIYKNTKTVRSMDATRAKIKKLLLEKANVEYYNGFVVIKGQTFNGVTKEYVQSLMHELKLVSKYDIARAKLKEGK